MKVGKAQFHHRRKIYFLAGNSALLVLPGFSLHPHICSHLPCSHFLTGKHQTILTAGTSSCSKCLRGNTFLVVPVFWWVSLPYMQGRVHMCPRPQLRKILKRRPHCTEVLKPQTLQHAINFEN